MIHRGNRTVVLVTIFLAITLVFSLLNSIERDMESDKWFNEYSSCMDRFTAYVRTH